jgi:hypothetical protein
VQIRCVCHATPSADALQVQRLRDNLYHTAADVAAMSHVGFAWLAIYLLQSCNSNQGCVAHACSNSPLPICTSTAVLRQQAQISFVAVLVESS